MQAIRGFRQKNLGEEMSEEDKSNYLNIVSTLRMMYLCLQDCAH